MSNEVLTKIGNKAEWVVGGAGGGAVTTLHINVTGINKETKEAIFTADKTPLEMQQASVTGPVWCVVTIAAGLTGQDAVSIGVPPAWTGGAMAFGYLVAWGHDEAGDNKAAYVVREATHEKWSFDVTQIGD